MQKRNGQKPKVSIQIIKKAEKKKQAQTIKRTLIF